VTNWEKDGQAEEFDIAVIGMACKFPQAANKEQFWDNLCRGVETVTFFSEAELLERNVPAKRLQNPHYVKAASTFERYDLFDAEFFTISPNEAACIDPQHRFFLESCWEAFEDAGYDPGEVPGHVGVFAGAGMNTYLTEVLFKNREFMRNAGQEQLMIGNDKDFLPTRVSYKLNLKGPSVSINTACSTSLVAIHMAKNSLLLGECDMALAGGVSISLLTDRGYTYTKDGILSQDGHCRPFDADAKGTIWGDGCGVVVLKRAADAQRDGDHIYAIIKGSAVNNDGSNKVGYTAPSVDEQSHVIRDALAAADLLPDDIHYVEAHGTGTQLGDLVELSALTQAYAGETSRRGFCPIGSVKANIGHANTAAGIAGFMKTVLALHHKQLPPSINFARPNPLIDFANSPFYVNTRLVPWDNPQGKLRAGVSSMGIGGTNCHVIVEQAESRVQANSRWAPPPPKEQALVLSARTPQALEALTDALANHLEARPWLSLEDVAFTLQCGRRPFARRRALRCRTLEEAVGILRSRDPQRLLDGATARLEDGSPLAQWLRGVNVDWRLLWQSSAPQRLPLPTYPFERQRFWVDPSSANGGLAAAAEPNAASYYAKQSDMSDWFYMQSWKQTPLPLQQASAKIKRRLVFEDPYRIARTLTERWREMGDTVVAVSSGSEFARHGDRSYVLNPADAAGYRRLLRELQLADLLPDVIVFAWGLEPATTSLIDAQFNMLVDTQRKTLFTLVHLVQALAELNITRPMHIAAVTNHAFDVIGNETANLSGSTVSAISMVIQQEYNYLHTRTIDVAIPEPGTEAYRQLTDLLLQEIDHETSQRVCAYRGNKRYERSYEHLRIEAHAQRHNAVRQDGVYLIYSGLEGVGYTISEHIARDLGAQVLIIEEDKFPEQARWADWVAERSDHPLTPRIQNALQLVEYGAAFVGTVGTVEETARTLAAAERRYGAIRGIIHAPGATGVRWRTNLKQFSEDGWSKHFKMINYSLIVLDQVFRGRNLDFRIMLSALASVLGGYGTSSVTTVSDFIKAYVFQQNRNQEKPWLIQCWDASQVLWGKVRQHIPSSMYDKMLEPTALTYEEGLECFDRTFAVRQLTEMQISATNLTKRFNRWVNMEEPRKETAPAAHPRPNLPTAYAPPQTSTERMLEALFAQLLGLEKVGIHDDFFELGGHSLLGLQIVSKARELFQIDMDSYDVYKHPSVSAMALFLESKLETVK